VSCQDQVPILRTCALAERWLHSMKELSVVIQAMPMLPQLLISPDFRVFYLPIAETGMHILASHGGLIPVEHRPEIQYGEIE